MSCTRKKASTSHSTTSPDAQVSGVGTVYRRFANKEQLIDGVFEQNFADIAAATEASLANPDPWNGLVSFAEFACSRMAVNRGLKDVINGTDEGCEQLACQRSIFEPAIEQMFSRAQAAGTLRLDAVVTDLFGLIFMVGALAEFHSVRQRDRVASIPLVRTRRTTRRGDGS